MDWAEIDKAIFAKLDTWSEADTDIFYPNQAVLPATSAWCELHVLQRDAQISRITGKDEGELQIQLGVFSKSENVYAVPTLVASLMSLIQRVTLSTTNYYIRFREMTAEQISRDDRKIWFCACTITAHAQEK